MLRTIIDKLAVCLRGEAFNLDKSIPLSYLFFLIFSKMTSLIYGVFLFHSFKYVFVHHSVIFKCKSNFFLGNNVSIERGCYIDALSTEGITVGNNVSFGKHTCIQCSGTLKCIGKGIKIGNNVGLGTHGFFGCAGGVEIGDNTIFGNYVSVHSENHNYSRRDIPIRLQGVNRKGIKIGKDCWIGAKVTILDGSEIGDGCVVAAGSVVRGCIPPYSIIAGIPAKVIKSR